MAAKKRRKQAPGFITRASRDSCKGSTYSAVANVPPPDWMLDPSLLPKRPPGRA